ncbi:hypothetical protein JX266_005098 [Neoarthrinium moseri]|uniref:uncharacterized protein n=1 Tax=Neoarthrinium moseri TaxID=1658444 RepID=UPI001FDD139C|nr:uncharacterized protein JN550_006433 [Neoarthrinium moseri]KAI1849137.1 hypothetical protein JX266_005098 [Neoarthrinium moseri]KAI1868517.1 hypothetical protein JN550_006433 [Neoarthrinium moseri]
MLLQGFRVQLISLLCSVRAALVVAQALTAATSVASNASSSASTVIVTTPRAAGSDTLSTAPSTLLQSPSFISSVTTSSARSSLATFTTSTTTPSTQSPFSTLTSGTSTSSRTPTSPTTSGPSSAPTIVKLDCESENVCCVAHYYPGGQDIPDLVCYGDGTRFDKSEFKFETFCEANKVSVWCCRNSKSSPGRNDCPTINFVPPGGQGQIA